LDTTLWPTAKGMALLPSNTQTKKKHLDQSFNHLVSSKQRIISTVMQNCHTKQHKALKKNIIPHIPLLCRTKRLTQNVVTQSWLQDLKNCDTTEYNQHQLEQDHSQQSKRITTTQSPPLHQKRPKPWYHYSKTLQSHTRTKGKHPTLKLMTSQLENRTAVHQRRQKKCFSKSQRRYHSLTNRITRNTC
jgi:hypothetical protein